MNLKNLNEDLTRSGLLKRIKKYTLSQGMGTLLKQIWSKTCQFTSKMRGFFPEKLPTSNSKLEEFTDTVLSLYGIPFHPSYKNAIATMIMHLSPTTDRKSKYYFVKSVRKAQANQVAYEMIDAIREEEKKAREAVTQALVNTASPDEKTAIN